MGAPMRYQPQGLVRINRAHPLARSVKFAFVPTRGDATGNPPLASYATAPSRFGRSTLPLNVGPFPSFGAMDVQTSGAFSVVLVGDFATAGAYTAPLLAHTTNSGGWKLGVTSAGVIGFTNYGLADYSGATVIGGTSGVLGVTVGLSPTTLRLFTGGAFREQMAIGTTPSASVGASFTIGNRPNGSDASSPSRIALALYFNRALTDAEHCAIAANPWQLLEAANEDEDELAAAAGGGAGTSITASWSEQGEVVSVAASASIAATAAWTEAPEATAIVAKASVSGAAAWAEAAEVTAVAASVAASAAIAWSEQPESVSVSASVRVNAAANWSESTEATAVVGTIGSDTTVSAAWTEAPEATAVSASVSISASAAWSETAESTSIAGSVGSSIAMGASWSEAPESCAALATVRVNASAGWAEQADIAGFSAEVLAMAGFGWAESSETMAAAIAVQAPPAAVLAWAERGESFSLSAHSESQIYARAPAGNGYSPQRNEYQSRPTQVGTRRPASTQRNNR